MPFKGSYPETSIQRTNSSLPSTQRGGLSLTVVNPNFLAERVNFIVMKMLERPHSHYRSLKGSTEKAPNGLLMGAKLIHGYKGAYKRISHWTVFAFEKSP